MHKEKKRRASWPMEYILGGIFVVALIVLVVHGFQSIAEEKAQRVDAALSGIAAAEVQRDASADTRRLPAAHAGEAYDRLRETESKTPAPTIVEVEDREEPVTVQPLPNYDEAEASFHARDYSRAVAGFTAYTLSYPHNPWGHYMLGLSQWKAGEAAEAEAALRRTLEESPEHFKALVNLGRVLMDQGRHEEALIFIDEALSLDPGSNAARRVRGRALHNLGRAVEAEQAYLEAIRLDPTDAWSLNNLGLILIESERFEEALAPLALAAQIDAETAVFQNNLGVALERNAHPAAARDAFALACEIDPGHEKARLSLARVEPLAAADESAPDLKAMAEAFMAGLGEEPAMSAGHDREEGESSVQAAQAAAIDDEALVGESQTALLDSEEEF